MKKTFTGALFVLLCTSKIVAQQANCITFENNCPDHVVRVYVYDQESISLLYMDELLPNEQKNLWLSETLKGSYILSVVFVPLHITGEAIPKPRRVVKNSKKYEALNNRYTLTRKWAEGGYFQFIYEKTIRA